MSLAVLELLIFLFFGVGLVIWLVALVDALRRPAADWTASGQNQLVWVAVILFANAVGGVLYWLIARPRFTEGQTAAA